MSLLSIHIWLITFSLLLITMIEALSSQRCPAIPPMSSLSLSFHNRWSAKIRGHENENIVRTVDGSTSGRLGVRFCQNFCAHIRQEWSKPIALSPCRHATQPNRACPTTTTPPTSPHAHTLHPLPPATREGVVSINANGPKQVFPEKGGPRNLDATWGGQLALIFYASSKNQSGPLAIWGAKAQNGPPNGSFFLSLGRLFGGQKKHGILKMPTASRHRRCVAVPEEIIKASILLHPARDP